jgi:hypothetical protein
MPVITDEIKNEEQLNQIEDAVITEENGVPVPEPNEENTILGVFERLSSQIAEKNPEVQQILGSPIMGRLITLINNSVFFNEQGIPHPMVQDISRLQVYQADKIVDEEILGIVLQIKDSIDILINVQYNVTTFATKYNITRLNTLVSLRYEHSSFYHRLINLGREDMYDSGDPKTFLIEWVTSVNEDNTANKVLIERSSLMYRVVHDSILSEVLVGQLGYNPLLSSQSTINSNERQIYIYADDAKIIEDSIARNTYKYTGFNIGDDGLLKAEVPMEVSFNLEPRDELSSLVNGERLIQNDIIAMVKPAGELRYSNVFKMQVSINTPLPFSKPMEPSEETPKEEDGFIAEEEKTEEE